MSSPSLAARLLLALVGAYRVLLSPLVGGTCRYTPSCSQYMADAVTRHGALRGGWLGLRRLARCHPFGGHGWDPVPENAEALFGLPSPRFISPSTLRRRWLDNRASRAVVR